MERTAHSKTMPLNLLGVADIVRGIGEGRFSAADVVAACLDRIAERDGMIGAWVEVDAAGALKQASQGLGSRAPLAGVPFGVKDVIDASALPTRMGSALYKDHGAPFDAGCVGLLRMAGGIMLGKTATCEFAGTQPVSTVNPRDFARTPGGSSSGSAAAVADGMVPLAFGTQTGGSVLRPAAFCGVVGFKPTYGFYPVSGMKQAAHSFDTVGTIARSVEDVALVHAALMALDPAVVAAGESPPRIGVLRTHLWETVEPASAANLEHVVSMLEKAGASISDIRAPEGFERITQRRAVINAFERARDLAGEWLAARNLMAPLTAEVAQRGFAITGTDYAAARADVEAFRTSASAMFDHVDLLLTPVTPGEAPSGLSRTGDPRLQEIWTMLHMPSIALPSGTGAAGLPLAVQLVGPRFRDAELLAAAAWGECRLAGPDAR